MTSHTRLSTLVWWKKHGRLWRAGSWEDLEGERDEGKWCNFIENKNILIEINIGSFSSKIIFTKSLEKENL